MPTSFDRPADFSPLQTGEIHVWRIPLTAPEDERERLREILSPDERRRGARFLFARHRHQFTVGRARLREIVALYAGSSPAQLVFGYTPLGKPNLAHPAAAALEFNFSNSHELGLLAVTRGAPVGVDLEWHRELSDLAGLARRFFHPTEMRCIEALEGDPQRQAFFRCWTRKEAYLKAVGKGLTFPLCRVQVTVAAAAPPRIEVIDDQAARASDWQLWHLVPDPGYVGAVAREGRGDRMVFLDYAGSRR